MLVGPTERNVLSLKTATAMLARGPLEGTEHASSRRDVQPGRSPARPRSPFVSACPAKESLKSVVLANLPTTQTQSLQFIKPFAKCTKRALTCIIALVPKEGVMPVCGRHPIRALYGKRDVRFLRCCLAAGCVGRLFLGGRMCPDGMLSPGGRCTLIVTFKPSLAGSRVASLTINHTATGSPLVITLQGIGSFDVGTTNGEFTRRLGASELPQRICSLIGGVRRVRVGGG
jgi:hypothetical protein